VIVVDTHVIIWEALQPEKLSRNAKAAIDEANANGNKITSEEKR